MRRGLVKPGRIRNNSIRESRNQDPIENEAKLVLFSGIAKQGRNRGGMNGLGGFELGGELLAM